MLVQRVCYAGTSALLDALRWGTGLGTLKTTNASAMYKKYILSDSRSCASFGAYVLKWLIAQCPLSRMMQEAYRSLVLHHHGAHCDAAQCTHFSVCRSMQRA
jgi:hypothetical protein